MQHPVVVPEGCVGWTLWLGVAPQTTGTGSAVPSLLIVQHLLGAAARHPQQQMATRRSSEQHLWPVCGASGNSSSSRRSWSGRMRARQM